MNILRAFEKSIIAFVIDPNIYASTPILQIAYVKVIAGNNFPDRY